MKIFNNYNKNLKERTLSPFSLLLFAFLLSFSLNSSAQAKFGHVNYTGIITNMPGIDSIQAIVTNYAADLQSIGEQMYKEFEEKQIALEKLINAGNTSQAVLKIRQDELMAIYKRMEEFRQSADADIQDRQVELLEPFQTKLTDAIKKVAKANNYNYIFDISTLLFYAASDDLTDKVKAELGIK